MKKIMIWLLAFVFVVSLAFMGIGCKEEVAPVEEEVVEEAAPVEEEVEEIPEEETEGFVIGLCNGYIGNTWRMQFVDLAQEVADKYAEQGIVKELIVQNTNMDLVEQISQMNSLIDMGVDALIVNPVSPEALKPVVSRAKEKGILLISLDNPSPFEDVLNIVGDHKQWFGIATKWLVETLDGEGDIVYMTGITGMAAELLRTEEAMEVLKDYPDINILTTVEGNYNETDAQTAMSNVLSIYDKIDGVLQQDGMAQGTVRAFEIDGREMPPMTGDYTFGFLRTWAKYPDLQSAGVVYNCGQGADGMEFTVKLLQGYKFREELFEPNPLDPSIINAILLPPPYVITMEAQQDAPWLEGTELVEGISLDDALKLGEGLPDTACVYSTLTEDQILSFLEPPK